ncbi:MAG: sulfatase-like hydrolase/transferase, partial [Myxococcales bacterium]|nr:sulfatase-like hydrolase/transferase [Myxococcales bacterium]
MVTNVLLILLDDVGVDQVSAYGYPGAPSTPVIDGLAERGLRFDHAWAMPTCSPTRAALLTGRQPLHNGVGSVIMSMQPKELALSEVTIPEMLDLSGTDWSSAAIGKWHLSTVRSPSAEQHPHLQGFDLFAGSLNNIVSKSTLPDRGEPTYVNWERVGFDGTTALEHRFSTTAIVDDTIEAVGQLQEPWFVYVPFHASHRPLMVPPDLPMAGEIDPADENALFAANVQAADLEIGRLLQALGPTLDHTLVFVIGDNGTPSYAKDADGQEGEKGSFLEGGVRVPFVVAGPGVAQGAHTDALAHIVDVFPTLMELAGVERAPAPLDGVSLWPVLRDPEATVRELVYSEIRHPAVGPPWTRVERAVSDGHLKAIDQGGEIKVYRLEGDAEVEVTGSLTRKELRKELPTLVLELN